MKKWYLFVVLILIITTSTFSENWIEPLPEKLPKSKNAYIGQGIGCWKTELDKKEKFIQYLKEHEYTNLQINVGGINIKDGNLILAMPETLEGISVFSNKGLSFEFYFSVDNKTCDLIYKKLKGRSIFESIFESIFGTNRNEVLDIFLNPENQSADGIMHQYNQKIDDFINRIQVFGKCKVHLNVEEWLDPLEFHSNLLDEALTIYTIKYIRENYKDIRISYSALFDWDIQTHFDCFSAGADEVHLQLYNQSGIEKLKQNTLENLNAFLNNRLINHLVLTLPYYRFAANGENKQHLSSENMANIVSFLKEYEYIDDVKGFGIYSFTQWNEGEKIPTEVGYQSKQDLDSFDSLFQEGIITFEEFGVTVDTFKDTGDWEKIVEDLFGAEYRVADWDDLQSYYSDGKDLIRLFDGLGLTKYNAHVFVTRDGEKSYTSQRTYFASRHVHDKPGSYLAHDDIDNYLISLGSWNGSRRILAIKKEAVGINNNQQQEVKPEKKAYTITGAWMTPVTALYSLSSKETIIRLEGETVIDTPVGSMMGATPFNYYIYNVPEGKYTMKLLWGGSVVGQKEIVVDRDLYLTM